MNTSPLKFAIIGCGMAAQNHLHAWREIPGARLAAICDTDPAKAEATAAQFGATVYSDAKQMFEQETLDFVDLTVPVEAHKTLIELAAGFKKHIIAETPYAQSVTEAKALNAVCRDAGVRLMIHESLRWQPGMRAVKAALQQPDAGKLYHGRISFRAPIALLTSRPGAAAQEHLALQRLGIHFLDLARFFFGDVKGLYCQTQTLTPGLKGDDFVSIMLRFASGAACIIEINVASCIETVPTTHMLLECEGGFVELNGTLNVTRNFRGKIESSNRVSSQATVPSPFQSLPFAWDAHFAATVAIQTHWIEALNTNTPPETNGADNLRSLALMLGAYESARTRQVFTP
jgi:predicted dehydrogenase